MPLICGLPDDLVLLCLARVPRRFHHILRCVSRRWRALLSSDEWHSCRQLNNLEEAWIYILCRDMSGENIIYVLDPDPERRSLKCLQPMPPACIKNRGMSFEVLGKKLYLLGGCNWHKDFSDDVYFYDSSVEKWMEATAMPTARCYFLSATLDDKIYVRSVQGSNSGPEGWDIYDLQTDRWSSLSDPMPTVDFEKSVTFEDKIYTFHKTWYDSRHARMYDPSSRKWEHLQNEFVSCRCGPTVVLDGTLYMLDETSGTRLMMWQKETEDWAPLGRLAEQLTKPPCHLVAIGRRIFIIGRMLHTVVVDVDKAAKVGGMLVTSSFEPKLGGVRGLEVIGCKTIAI